jgi:hypothetical protein
MKKKSLIGKDVLETWLNILQEYVSGEDLDRLVGAVISGLSGEPIDEEAYYQLYGILKEHEKEIGVNRVVLISQLAVGGEEEEKGGPGSGYHRPHYGRPGLRGGSLPRSLGEEGVGRKYIFSRFGSVDNSRLKYADKEYRDRVEKQLMRIVDEVRGEVMDKVSGDMKDRADRYFQWLDSLVDRVMNSERISDVYDEVEGRFREVIEPVRRDEVLRGMIKEAVENVLNRFRSEFKGSLRVDFQVGGVKIVNIDDEVPAHLYLLAEYWGEFISKALDKKQDASLLLCNIMSFSSKDFLRDDIKKGMLEYFQSDDFKELVGRFPDVNMMVYPMDCSIQGCSGLALKMVSGVVLLGNNLMFLEPKGFRGFNVGDYIKVWTENVLSHEAGHVWIEQLGLRGDDLLSVYKQFKIGWSSVFLPGEERKVETVVGESLAELFRCAVAGRFGSDIGVVHEGIDKRPYYGGGYVSGVYNEYRGWNKKVVRNLVVDVLKLNPEKIINPELKEILRKVVKGKVIKFVIVG